MARSTKDLIKSLMKKLDLLHTKYVHVWINNQFFENDKYEEYMDMLDEWSIDGYYDSYNWLLRCDETSKEKGRAAESANQVMAEFLSVWKRKASNVFKEAIELLAYCAEHEFINMTPTLKERIDGDWKETGTDDTTTLTRPAAGGMTCLTMRTNTTATLVISGSGTSRS